MPLEDSVVFNHPSYAIIGLSRITGTRSLFNSPFAHQGFMRLRIGRAEKHRHLSNDWIHSLGQPLIEVDLSYSQFAEFLTSANIGDGVPCTINRFQGQGVPEPEIENYFETFKTERDVTIQKCSDAFNALDALIGSLNISKKAQGELYAAAKTARRAITDSIPFIEDQFVEHMEGVTAKAKVEIASYGNAVVHQLGLAALRGESPGIPAFGLPIDIKALPGSAEPKE